MKRTDDSGLSCNKPTVYIITNGSPPQPPIFQRLTKVKRSICCVSSVRQLLEKYEKPGCSCLLLNEELAGTRDLDVLTQLNRAEHFPPVILLIDSPDTVLTVEAMRNGAYAVLDHLACENVLLSTIHNAMQFGVEQQAQTAVRRVARAHFDELKQQEWEVLQAVLDGIPNKRIARNLNVSMRTVENRRRRIYEVTKVNCVTQLVRKAIRAGIIDP